LDQLAGFDALFAKTHIVLLILFGFCCGYIALILGIVGLVACHDPRAKQNALIVTIIAAIQAVGVTVGGILTRH
jgi:hypothetical protein